MSHRMWMLNEEVDGERKVHEQGHNRQDTTDSVDCRSHVLQSLAR